MLVISRRALVGQAAAVGGMSLFPRKAGAFVRRFVGGVASGGGGSPLALQRLLNQPLGTTTPAAAFWTIGHPYKLGDVPSGEITTATLGGTSVRLQGSALKMHGGGSLSWAQLYVDYSGVTIAPGSSAALVQTPVSGSWSTATSRTNAEVAALNHTIQITNLSTSGTSAPDMDGAGTWIATLDPTSGSNQVEVYAQGPVARHIKISAPFFNGATQHRYLYAVMEYVQYQTAGGAAGPIAYAGPYIANVWGFKTNPSQFTYDLNFLANGVSQRTEHGIPHCALAFAPFSHPLKAWEYTASDPQVWVSQDYTIARKTLKIPTFADGIVYAGDPTAPESAVPSQTVTSITTGVFVVANTTPIFGSGTVIPSAVQFTASSFPSPLAANTTYWALKGNSNNNFTLYDTLGHAIAGGSTGQISPATIGTGLTVVTVLGPTTPAGIGQNMPGTGARADISMLTEWGAAYTVAGASSNPKALYDLGRVVARAFSGIPGGWLLADGGTGGVLGKQVSYLSSGQTPVGFGTPTYGGVAGTITCTNGAGSQNSANLASPTGGTNQWATDTEHFPNPVYAVWLFEGGAFLRDMLWLAASKGVMYETFLVRRNMAVNGGTTRNGLTSFHTLGTVTRKGAWTWRDKFLAAYASSSGSDEETLFENYLNNDASYFADYLAYKDPSGTTYAKLGWIFYDEGNYPPSPSQPVSNPTLEGFEMSYMGFVTAFGSMLYGDRVPAMNTIADFTAQLIAGFYNTSYCNYYATNYAWCASLSGLTAASPGTYVSSVPEIGGNINGGSGIQFNYAANGNVTIVGSSEWTPNVGDIFRPLPFDAWNDSTTPATPAQLNNFQDYFVVSGGVTFTISATKGGSPITVLTPQSGCGGVMAADPASCPANNGGTLHQGQALTNGDNYLMYQVAFAALQSVRGATGCATAYTNANNRSQASGPPDYNVTAGFAFQGTV